VISEHRASISMRALAALAFKKKDKPDSNTNRDSTSSVTPDVKQEKNEIPPTDSSSSSSQIPAHPSSSSTIAADKKSKKAKLFQFFDKEGDPFYFDMETGAISWTITGGRAIMDSVSYISHQSESGQYYESVKAMIVTWDLPMDEFSEKARKVLPSLHNIDRYELEGLIGVSYSLGESLEQYQMLEEYLLELDEQRAAQGNNPAPAARNRPQSVAMPAASRPIITAAATSSSLSDDDSDEEEDEISPSPSPEPIAEIRTNVPFGAVPASKPSPVASDPKPPPTPPPIPPPIPAVPIPPNTVKSLSPLSHQSRLPFPSVDDDDEEEDWPPAPSLPKQAVPPPPKPPSASNNPPPPPVPVPPPPKPPTTSSNPSPPPPKPPATTNNPYPPPVAVPPPPKQPVKPPAIPQPPKPDNALAVTSKPAPPVVMQVNSTNSNNPSPKPPAAAPAPPPPMPKAPPASNTITTTESSKSPPRTPSHKPNDSHGSEVDTGGSPASSSHATHPRASIISAPSFLPIKDPRVDELTTKMDDLRHRYEDRERSYQTLRSAMLQVYQHPAGGSKSLDKAIDDESMIKSITNMLDNLVAYNQSIIEKMKVEQNRVQEMNRRMMDVNERFSDLEDEKQRALQDNLRLQAEHTRLQEEYRILEVSRQQENESLAMEKAQFERSCLDRVEKAKADSIDRISFLEKANQDLITELGLEIKKNQTLLMQQRQAALDQKNNSTRVDVSPSTVLIDSQTAEANNDNHTPFAKPELKRRDEHVIPISMHSSAINDLKQQLDTANIRIRSLEDELFMNSNNNRPSISRELSSSAPTSLTMPKSVLAAKSPDARAKDLWASSLMLPNALESTTVDVYNSQNSASANGQATTTQMPYSTPQQQKSLVVPTEYIRRQSRLYPSLQVMQYFPLELSNIDYLHRAFYIVSSCLKLIVMDLLRQRVKLLDMPVSSSSQMMTPEKSSPQGQKTTPNASTRRTSSGTRSFIVYSNDTTNRKRSFYSNSEAIAAASSTSPAMSPIPFDHPASVDGKSKQASSSESYIRQRQFMKISSRMLSLEEMLIVILALRIDHESRLPILANHAQQLGFASVDEMSYVMNNMLQFYRYVQKQTYSSMLDTGKICNFADFFSLCKSILTPIANLINDNSATAAASGNHLHRRISQSATYTVLNYCQAATLSLNELWNLENQIKSHAKWKEMRMLEMGWIWDDFNDHMTALNAIMTKYSSSSSSNANAAPASGQSAYGNTLGSPMSMRMSPTQMLSPTSQAGMTPMSMTMPNSVATNGDGGGVFWRTEYYTPTAANKPRSSIKTSAGRDSVYFPISSPQPLDSSINETASSTAMSKTAQPLTAEKASMLYESLRVKLFSLLTPQEMAIHKIIIRFIGYLEYIKPQVKPRPAPPAASSSMMQKFFADDDQEVEEEPDELQLLYESIRSILLSFNEKKPLSRRRSTFIWSDGGDEKKVDGGGLGDQHRLKSNEDDDEAGDEDNYFYTHPKLRKLHRLLFKSAETLAKLGIVVSDFSANNLSSNNTATMMDSRSFHVSNSVLPIDKVKDIISIHRDLQNLLIPYDAKSAICTHFASSNITSSGSRGRRKSGADSISFDPSTPIQLTGNLVYRIASHIDGHSIASLLLLSGSKDLIGAVFKTLYGLTMPLYHNKSASASVPARNLNLQNFIIEDASSCRDYGFLCSELRVTRLYHNHDILQAKYPLHELVGMNFNVDDLRIAGYSVPQCREIGLDASEIRAGRLHCTWSHTMVMMKADHDVYRRI
jgi:hypothetical protein